jgi:hypothetical protein
MRLLHIVPERQCSAQLFRAQAICGYQSTLMGQQRPNPSIGTSDRLGASPCENPPRHRQHVIFDLICC